MLNYPTLLVAIWFLPVFLCLIIPMLFPVSNSVLRLVSFLLSPKNEYSIPQVAEQKV